MDQPRIENVLKIMRYMRVPHTVNELAELMGTTYRSVYRYIEGFKTAGFVVVNNGKYYSLDRSSKPYKEFSQLLSFSDEEAYLIDKAIDSICETNVTGLRVA